MCLLGLSYVLKDQTLSYYRDVNHRHLFNCNSTPRTSNIKQKCFRILFYRNEAFGTFVLSANFESNHFVPLLPAIQKTKKSNPSQTSSSSKKICLKLLKMESIVYRIQTLLETTLCLIKSFSVYFLNNIS